MTGDRRVQFNVVKAVRRLATVWIIAPRRIGPLVVSNFSELRELTLSIKQQWISYDFKKPRWNWLPTNLESLKILIEWTPETRALFFDELHRLPYLTHLVTPALGPSAKVEARYLDALPRTLKTWRLENQQKRRLSSEVDFWSWQALSHLPPSLEVLETHNSTFDAVDMSETVKLPNLRVLKISGIPLHQFCRLVPSIRELKDPCYCEHGEGFEVHSLPPLEVLSIILCDSFEWSILPSSLTRLHVKGVGQRNIDPIAEYCPQLVSLYCEDLRQAQIGNFPLQLEELILSGISATVAPSSFALPNLTTLSIIDICIESWTQFNWMRTLQSLELPFLDHPTCEALTHLPHLITFRCNESRQVTKASYSALLPNSLRTLVVPAWNFEYLVLPIHLTRLEMPERRRSGGFDTPDDIQEVTGEIRARIGQIPSDSLTTLVWGSIPVSSLMLCAIIADCQKLRSLSLGSSLNPCPEAVFQFLHFLPAIERLELSFHRRLQQPHIETFATLPKLKKLVLSASNISAIGYRHEIKGILPHINVWVHTYYDFV
jgi:hypothetical protein